VVPVPRQTRSKSGSDPPADSSPSTTDASKGSVIKKQGAVECLFKPFSDTELRDPVNAALRVR
jgi:hypothetical protein